jgi:hypothetical protein
VGGRLGLRGLIFSQSRIWFIQDTTGCMTSNEFLAPKYKYDVCQILRSSILYHVKLWVS